MKVSERVVNISGFYTFKVQYGPATHFVKFRVQILEAPKIEDFNPLPDYVMVSRVIIVRGISLKVVKPTQMS